MLSGFFGPKKPSYVKSGKFYPLTRGYNLKLAGDIKGDAVESVDVNRYALKPTDFNGISPIPKLLVEIGDEVEAGTPIFYDKKRPEIMYASPVSGEVVEVNRGAKRAITEVVILADKKNRFKSFSAPSLGDREALVKFLTESGAWAFINQRPFDIVAEVNEVPRDIFISTFDTAPLALDLNHVVSGNERHFSKGIEVLANLTEGKVYIGADGNGTKPSEAFTNNDKAEVNYFAGPHPAGNVGVQIHHVKPIKNGEMVWTVDVPSVILIGKLFNEGKYDVSRLVKVAGSSVKEPKIVKTYLGANIGDIVGGNIKDGHQRIVSGNVLTGEEVEKEGYLGFKDNLISVLPEGDHYQLFGWLNPLKPKPTVSGKFPTFLWGNKPFTADTNTNGERRAFVVTGEYEKMLPMDIYPQHLIKAILTNDIERMEGLGLVELTEEDVALCEFACTSKMPVQNILRDGLNMLREQS